MSSISSSIYSITGINKYVFNFDLDETLFKLKLSEPKETSGGLIIDDAKVISAATLWKKACWEYKDFQVLPIDREKFKGLFGRITKLNRDAKETVIFVNIITNSNYTKFEVLNVLKKFYGDDFTIHLFANREREYPTKGEQMMFDFSDQYWRLGIPRNQIYLIDDLEENCLDFETYNFKAIRAAPGQDVFESLDAIVDDVRERIFPEIKEDKFKQDVFESLDAIVDDVREKIFPEIKDEKVKKTKKERFKNFLFPGKKK